MSQVVTFNGLVGYELEKRRKEIEKDQGWVAARAGLSQPVLSRLEKGKATITIDQLFALSEALDIGPQEVIRRAKVNAELLTMDKGIKVTTAKHFESAMKENNGNQGGALLVGAAIGGILALLASRK